MYESNGDLKFTNQIRNFKMNDYLFCRNEKKTWLVNNPLIINDVSSLISFTNRIKENKNSEISSNY